MQQAPTIPSSNTTPRKRGIIVVDASVLLLLTLPADEKFLSADHHHGKPEEDIKRYSDLLVFLAKHGYEIIIPEMVSYAASRVLRDGTSPDKKFDIPGDEYNLLMRHARPFLSSVGYGNYENIRIEPPEAQANSQSAIFINRMYEGSTLHDRAMARKEIANLQGEFPEKKRKGFGETAAAEMITHMPNANVPVFYLCNDKDARQRIFSANKNRKKSLKTLGKLNLNSLLLALKKECLFDAAGLHNVDDVADIANRIYAVQNTVSGSKGKSSRSPSVDYFCDSTGTEDEPNDLPFHNSIQGLREDVRTEEIAARAAQEAAEIDKQLLARELKDKTNPAAPKSFGERYPNYRKPDAGNDGPSGVGG